MKRNLTTAYFPHSETSPAAKPLLGKLVKWTVLAVLALTITALVLYTAGSYRKASDDSQLVLVRFCLIVSMLLIISSIYGLLLNLYYAIRKQQAAYLAGILGYLLIIALGLFIVLGSAFIIGATGGNR